jgi:hypothetical protein
MNNKVEYFDLASMRNVDITSVDPDTLVDIRDIDVKIDKPLLERALDYMSQVKNPYCFRHGNILIKTTHIETDTTIEDCMEGCFRATSGIS